MDVVKPPRLGGGTTWAERGAGPRQIMTATSITGNATKNRTKRYPSGCTTRGDSGGAKKKHYRQYLQPECNMRAPVKLPHDPPSKCKRMTDHEEDLTIFLLSTTNERPCQPYCMYGRSSHSLFSENTSSIACLLPEAWVADQPK